MTQNHILKVGDVVFRSYNRYKEGAFKDIFSFINFMISKFTASRMTHVGIIVDIHNDNYIIAQSNEDGFDFDPTGVASFNKKVRMGSWRVLRIPRLKTNNIKQMAEGLIGTPYGFFDIFKFVVWNITGKKLFKASEKRMICSESIARILYSCGIDVRGENKNFKFDYVSPAKVYDELQMKHKAKLVLI